MLGFRNMLVEYKLQLLNLKKAKTWKKEKIIKVKYLQINLKCLLSQYLDYFGQTISSELTDI